VEELLDFWTAHIQEPVFVGNSIGAPLSLMVDYPQIATGGVLINCAGGLSHRPHELNPPLRLVGNLNRLVRSKLTGQVLFNRVRQKRKFGARSCKSTATREHR